MLNRTVGEIKFSKNSEVISGAKNLKHDIMLQNKGNVKRLMKDYIKQNLVLMSQKNEVKHDKREFIPFVDERDQIGRLIANVRTIHLLKACQQDYHNYYQFPKDYIKKTLVFKPRKV